MEHTEYYQLSLWDADDRIMREDFNDNNAKIDAALAEKPFVIGEYRGDGTMQADGGQTVELGFHARFIIVTHSDDVGFYNSSAGITEADTTNGCGRLTDTGFTVWSRPNSANQFIGNLNYSGFRYRYIAFR